MKRFALDKLKQWKETNNSKPLIIRGARQVGKTWLMKCRRFPVRWHRSGYEMNVPKGGGSHYAFRKSGCQPITIPKHEPIKKVYVEMVKQIVESEANNDENAE